MYTYRIHLTAMTVKKPKPHHLEVPTAACLHHTSSPSGRTVSPSLRMVKSGSSKNSASPSVPTMVTTSGSMATSVVSRSLRAVRRPVTGPAGLVGSRSLPEKHPEETKEDPAKALGGLEVAQLRIFLEQTWGPQTQRNVSRKRFVDGT